MNKEKREGSLAGEILSLSSAGNVNRFLSHLCILGFFKVFFFFSFVYVEFKKLKNESVEFKCSCVLVDEVEE